MLVPAWGPVHGGTAITLAHGSTAFSEVYRTDSTGQRLPLNCSAAGSSLHCCCSPPAPEGRALPLELLAQRSEAMGTRPLGAHHGASSRLTFVYYNEPRVLSIRPQRGPVDGGTAVTLAMRGWPQLPPRTARAAPYQGASCRFGSALPVPAVPLSEHEAAQRRRLLSPPPPLPLPPVAGALRQPHAAGSREARQHHRSLLQASLLSPSSPRAPAESEALLVCVTPPLAAGSLTTVAVLASPNGVDFAPPHAHGARGQHFRYFGSTTVTHVDPYTDMLIGILVMAGTIVLFCASVLALYRSLADSGWLATTPPHWHALRSDDILHAAVAVRAGGRRHSSAGAVPSAAAPPPWHSYGAREHGAGSGDERGATCWCAAPLRRGARHAGHLHGLRRISEAEFDDDDGGPGDDGNGSADGAVAVHDWAADGAADDDDAVFADDEGESPMLSRRR